MKIKIIKILAFSILLLSFYGCSKFNGKSILNNKYKGFWAETFFSYEFYRNKKFRFQAKGHYGDTDLEGTYIVENDTINLFFKDEKLKSHGVIGVTYILEDGKKCIKELETQISYCLNLEYAIQKVVDSDIIETISKIDKVVERDLYIQKKSDGRRSLGIVITSRPDENEYGKYWVKVVEDNGINLVSHFNFLVDKDDMKIYYLDTATDSLIELREW